MQSYPRFCQLILLLLPHFAAPGGYRYPVPFASAVLLIGLLHIAWTTTVASPHTRGQTQR